jgi:murein DD-endopeptidase MepM/ murein hydrolase activator NlpD
MHCKTRTAVERLRTLRDRLADRLAPYRRTSTARHRRSGPRHRLGTLAESSAILRAVATRGLAGRNAVVTVTAAGILAAGFVGATAAVANPRNSPAGASAALGAHDRELAAMRVDRAGRTAIETPPAPAPAAPPAPVAAPPPAPDWINPMPGAPLSSCYGPRWGALHQGIDFAGNDGQTVHAVGAGTVVGAGWLYSGYGMSIMIDHGNGYFSHYAHLQKVVVSEGQHVVAGQGIGLEGSTGDSTGPHLHFEIHQGMWSQIDPMPWLRARGVDIPGC